MLSASSATTPYPCLLPLLNIELDERYPCAADQRRTEAQKTLELLIDGTLALAKASCDPCRRRLAWADPSTIELLGLLLDQVPTHPSW